MLSAQGGRLAKSGDQHGIALASLPARSAAKPKAQLASLQPEPNRAELMMSELSCGRVKPKPSKLYTHPPSDCAAAVRGGAAIQIHRAEQEPNAELR